MNGGVRPCVFSDALQLSHLPTCRCRTFAELQIGEISKFRSNFELKTQFATFQNGLIYIFKSSHLREFSKVSKSGCTNSIFQLCAKIFHIKSLTNISNRKVLKLNLPHFKLIFQLHIFHKYRKFDKYGF